MGRRAASAPSSGSARFRITAAGATATSISSSKKRSTSATGAGSAAGTGLDVQERVAAVHFTGEHAPEFESLDLRLEALKVGYLVDYDMQTWKVEAYNVYAAGEALFDEEKYVEAIEIFTTTLKTPDNKIIIIPNAKLSGDNIINYSAQETRRVDMTVGVAYDADLSVVRDVLNDIISKEERVLQEPAPLIAVAELADNSVNFVVRVWTSTGDYWGVKFAMTETIKNRFDAEGIGIPFPQRDIHIVSGQLT